MIFEKHILDSNIFLYKKSIDTKLLNEIQSLESIKSKENIWSIASKGNILNTAHTYNKDILNLFVGDVVFPYSLNEYEINKQIFNIKEKINNHTFDAILDYSNIFEINIKKIKNWTICRQKNGSETHSDKDNDGSKHSYSILLLLNDNYSGGQLYFNNRIGNDSIHMSAGDILIYPSDETHIHYELPIISGIKYTAISYFN